MITNDTIPLQSEEYNSAYDSWNTVKKEIHHHKDRLHFRQGEVWFVSLGQNIGYEVFGKGDDFLRPVIIFRKINKSTFLAIPLTSKIKDDRYHCQIHFKDKQNLAILTQIRILDAKRLAYKIGNLEKVLFENLEEKFVEFYNLTPQTRGGYTHPKDEQRVNTEIVSESSSNVN